MKIFKSMSKSYACQKLLGICLLLTAPHATAESILEMHERMCASGNQKSCERASVMQSADEQAKRIEQLGDAYAGKIDRDRMELENKPDLESAYLEVMQDYFLAEKANGVEQSVSNQMLTLCAGHYHNYWRNQKLWWPTNEQGSPDWSTIYYFIVDHYYGYCLRNTLSGASNS